MKVQYIFIALFLFFGCKPDNKTAERERPAVKTPVPPKVEKIPDPWDEFWLSFQTAVKEGDVEKIVASTILPLPGSEPLNNGRLVSKATFEEHFSKLFDAKAVETFSASTGNLSDFSTKSKIVAEQLNVPMNVKIRAITVFYVYDEGTDNQTESSMTFHFAETGPGTFKLVSIIAAG